MYKPCSKFEGKFETKKAVFLCNDGLGHPGQFVYIRDDREEQEYFGLCEVEVFEFTSKFKDVCSSWNSLFICQKCLSIHIRKSIFYKGIHLLDFWLISS